LIVRLVLPGRSESIFQRVASIAERWGRRFAIVVLLGLGITLEAEGISFLFGYPILPDRLALHRLPALRKRRPQGGVMGGVAACGAHVI
jgi:hypothetical protein